MWFGLENHRAVRSICCRHSNLNYGANFGLLLMISNWQFFSGCFCWSVTCAVSCTTIVAGAHWLCREVLLLVWMAGIQVRLAMCKEALEPPALWRPGVTLKVTRHSTASASVKSFCCLCNVSVLMNVNCELAEQELMCLFSLTKAWFAICFFMKCFASSEVLHAGVWR